MKKNKFQVPNSKTQIPRLKFQALSSSLGTFFPWDLGLGAYNL